MKLSTFYALVALPIALTIPPISTASDLPKRLVCYDDIFQPFFMQNQDEISGLNVDIIAEAGRRLGITVEFRQIPFKRLELELSRGNSNKIECGFSFSQTEARKKYMTFGHVPLQATDYTLFVRDEHPGIKTVADLEDKVIGVRSGFVLPDAIKNGDNDRHWHIDDVGSDEVNFKKLLLKRVDAVLTNHDVGLYTIRELKLHGIRALTPPLTHFDTYLVFSKSDSSIELSAAFDHALSEMMTDGTIKRFREKYLGSNGDK